MYRLLRPLLFRADAETIHHRVLRWTSLVLAWSWVRAVVRWWYRVTSPRLAQTIWGLEFDNPVGLAAGFDKNARHFNALGALGFGFIEVGTLTGQGQVGNARPRMFRLPEDRALLNRMGFNNEGSEAAAARLEQVPIEPLLGINIGKTKVVPLEEAPADYEQSFRRLYPWARYFAVNVSSPNTPNLRELQSREPLLELMSRLGRLNHELAEERGERPRPLLLKIAPDIHEALLEDILDVIEQADVDGVIATNTTVQREGLETPGQQELGPGGVSGAPVRERARQVVAQIHERTGGELPIIGVGGVFGPEDALELIEAGAWLVQVWTGFVYEGPGLVRRINRGLERACRERGASSIAELRGARGKS